MRFFGWMRVSEHEKFLHEVRVYQRGIRDTEVNSIKQDHEREVQALRSEIIDLRNQLARAKGAAVADAHAKGKPAP